MRVAAVIPVRLASTRFPRKPLAPILGLPMVEHVRRRCHLSADIDEVVVATCDEEIRELVEASGGTVIMTSASHERGTDRVAEAASSIEADIIINVQGDEPLVTPGMLSSLAEVVAGHSGVDAANLVTSIKDEAELMDPNAPKVVADLRGDVLYISREPIPSGRFATSGEVARYKQIGIYAFSATFLQEFTQLEPTPLEVAESVDMLRIVEHGHRLRIVPVSEALVGVDEPGDIRRVEAVLAVDPLFEEYQ